MITMQEVYRNSNEWLVQQHDLEYMPREVYVVEKKTWWQKIAEYLKEII